MPTFRTRPSLSLNDSIRRMVGSGRNGALGEMQADMAAARTAKDMSLADKARAEVEAMQAADAARRDPAKRTEYASDAAGITQDDGTRLFHHLRGSLEEPGIGDVMDASLVGNEAQPYPTAAPNLEPGQKERFQTALASTMANLLATGKTNAQQMTAAGTNLQKQGLMDEASRAPDVPTGNRIIAAMSGKLREPFKVGNQGQVLNEETGAVNEGTALAQAAKSLLGARTTTEGSRQGELATRADRNDAYAGLADARTDAVDRGADRGGRAVNPAQVEKWIGETALREWKEFSASQRKGMNYQQHLDKVRERFKASTGAAKIDVDAETADAHQALAGGANADAVRKRFKERTGIDLPEPADAGADDTEE